MFRQKRVFPCNISKAFVAVLRQELPHLVKETAESLFE
jgi:hypothetical protein